MPHPKEIVDGSLDEEPGQAEPQGDAAWWSIPRVLALVTSVETANYLALDSGVPASLILLGTVSVALTLRKIGRAIASLPSKLRKRSRNDDPPNAQQALKADEEKEENAFYRKNKRIKVSSDEEESEPKEEEDENLSENVSEDEEVEDVRKCEHCSCEDDQDEDEDELSKSESSSEEEEEEEEEEESDSSSSSEDSIPKSPDLLFARTITEGVNSLATEVSSNCNGCGHDDEEGSQLMTQDVPMTQCVDDDDDDDDIYTEVMDSQASQVTNDVFRTPHRPIKSDVQLTTLSERKYPFQDQNERGCLDLLAVMKHSGENCLGSWECKQFKQECQTFKRFQDHVITCRTRAKTCSTCAEILRSSWQHSRVCKWDECDMPTCLRKRSREASQESQTA